jgi:hypothetical protein
MNKFLYSVLVILFLGLSQFVFAFDLGTWNIINLKYKHTKKLSLFGEAQLRSLKMYDQFHYYEYKGGVNYKFKDNVVFTLAMGSYQTYKEGGNFELPKNNNEIRIWPQITLYQNIGSLRVEQRYRSESRFTTRGYRNRFRYRCGLSYPFGKDLNGFKPYQIGISNELFFTDTEPYFERNRILVAIQYKISGRDGRRNGTDGRPSIPSSIQIGYLHQFDYKINDETGRDFLQIGYFIEL